MTVECRLLSILEMLDRFPSCSHRMNDQLICLCIVKLGGGVEKESRKIAFKRRPLEADV